MVRKAKIDHAENTIALISSNLNAHKYCHQFQSELGDVEFALPEGLPLAGAPGAQLAGAALGVALRVVVGPRCY